MEKSKVYLISTSDRKAGVKRCFSYFKPVTLSGKDVFIKPNFNTADITPGSTHNDTLEQLMAELKALNPKAMTLGERSGPANVAEVFRQKNIPELCETYGVKLVNFEELKPEEWVPISRADLHWPGSSFLVPKVVADSDAVIATCCLKTHAYGGVFSASLKLAVGLTPKDFMTLHKSDDMRKMIAEINLAYSPELVILDAVDVFTDGGPMEGTRAKANVFLAGNDRIALDAVGLALLKLLGSNKAIMETPIFKQEQLARAVELGLGVTCPEEIEIVTDDTESETYAEKLSKILSEEVI